MRKKLIVILGPTASGKTNLGIKLAKKFNGEIINADSRTIYKEFNIGTDKPGKDKNKKEYTVSGIQHYLIDFLKPNKEFSVAEYQNQAKEKIKEIQKKDKAVFMVGGSPLYIDSVIYDYKIPKVEPNWKLREKLTKEPLEKLVSKLKKINSKILGEIDLKNKRKIIRVLEISLKGETKNKKPKKIIPNILILGIKTDRKELYKTINRRVDNMIKKGLISEVKKLLKKYKENAPALSGIGYREIVSFFKKEISKEEAIELIKRNSRHFAKRQLTWFRRDKNINWVLSQNEAEKKIKDFLRV